MADHVPLKTREALIAFAGRLDGVEAIGFDTEFHAENSYWPKVMLLQFSTPDEVVLVDPLAEEIKGAIGGFLELIRMRAQIVVGHALEHDLEIFHRLSGGLPARIFDTQRAAAFCGYGGPIGLGPLLSALLKVDLPKAFGRADWGRRPLPQAQLRYAADDVAHLLPARAALEAALETRGRHAWLEEEQASLLDPESYAAPSPEDAWKRIRRRGRSAEGFGILVSVAAERERLAQAADLPPRRILPDDVVLDWATRAPGKKAELKGGTRRNAGPHLDRHADAWLDAIRFGLEMGIEPPAEALPSDEAVLARELLRFSVRFALSRAEVAPWLIEGSYEALDALVEAPTRDRAELLERLGWAGWRTELLGDRLQRILQGAPLKIVELGGTLRVEAADLS
ncbi:MAG: hypothetical protein AAF627_09835 [Myxococcota bacterium]